MLRFFSTSFILNVLCILAPYHGWKEYIFICNFLFLPFPLIFRPLFNILYFFSQVKISMLTGVFVLLIKISHARSIDLGFLSFQTKHYGRNLIEKKLLALWEEFRLRKNLFVVFEILPYGRSPFIIDAHHRWLIKWVLVWIH